MHKPVRLGWAVSGRGETLRGVFNAHEAGLIRSAIHCVVTDRPADIEAFLVKRNVPTVRIEGRSTDRNFQTAFKEVIAAHQLDWIGLTFNRLLSKDVIDAIDGRIFNLHMALLPAFPGFGAIQKALESGVRLTGVTVHLVDAGIDTGPILAQGVSPVGAKESLDQLGRRLFETSHPMVLQVVRSIELGEITLDADRRPTWQRADHVASVRNWFPPIDDDIVEFAKRFCAATP